MVHPILSQLGPLTVMTHDAFTVLALAVGLAIYYRELRRRGWLDATDRLDLARGGPRRRDRRPR